MKKLFCLLLAASLGAGILSGCAARAQPLPASPVPTDPLPSKNVDSALTALGLELVKATRGEDGTLLSPLSIALALSMAANGAEGETLAQFEALLGGGADLAELNAACAQLMTDYQALGGSTKSTIANSLWADPDGQVSEEYAGTCRGVFDAEVFQTQLDSPAIVPQLNGWVKDKTDAMIPSLIDQPFSPEAAAVLVNALYLENRFSKAFDPNDTYTRVFSHADSTPEDREFMHASSGRYSYIKGEGVQGVILPYDDGRLGFAALLPDSGLDSWLSSLSGSGLSGLFLSGQETPFTLLALPKFEFEWNGSLAAPLAGLGLDLAFTEGQADFSRLGTSPDGYHISDVIHATKIEVKEEGTRAAAVTAIVMECTSALPPEEGVTLILDHPFLYGIVDLQTGLPLFLGTFE